MPGSTRFFPLAKGKRVGFDTILLYACSKLVSTRRSLPDRNLEIRLLSVLAVKGCACFSFLGRGFEEKQAGNFSR